MNIILKKIIILIKRNFLLIILSFTSIVTLVPLIKYGMQAAFYHVDPDVVYLGNAISYIKSNTIFYSGHPGTPAIIILAWSFWPLRIIAKLFDHKPFVLWAFDNLRLLFIYGRLIFFSIFTVSMFLFFKSVRELSKSYYPVIFTCVGMFLFVPFFELGPKIYAENSTFFIVSLWLLFFAYYSKKQNILFLYILSILSGLGMAVKLNNYVLVIATFLFTFINNKKYFVEKLKHLSLIVCLTFGTFFISTWSIRSSYKPMFTRFFNVALRSGIEGAHGSGGSPFVDFANYFLNLKGLFISNTIPFYIVLVTIVGMLYLIIVKRIRLTSNYSVLFFSVFASSLILLKYPLAYYQLPSYLIYLFLAGFLLNKLKIPAQLIIIILLLSPMIKVVNNNLDYALKLANSSVLLERRLAENKIGTITLWDYGPAKDFAYIWIRSWAGGTFREELSLKAPNLLELDADYKRVYRKYYSDKNDIWEICWDKLYIRENRAQVFLSKYSDKNLKVLPIIGTNIWEIQSNHCVKNFSSF